MPDRITKNAKGLTFTPNQGVRVLMGFEFVCGSADEMSYAHEMTRFPTGMSAILPLIAVFIVLVLSLR